MVVLCCIVVCIVLCCVALCCVVLCCVVLCCCCAVVCCGCAVLCGAVRCGAVRLCGVRCAVWCGVVWCGVVVCVAWLDAGKTSSLPLPHAKVQHASVCTFKTPSCVPEKRPHVEHMRACCRYKRGRFECAHGSVLNLNTGGEGG